jgi:hypothetical protein
MGVGKFYIHKKMQRFAPTYEHMFIDPNKQSPLTQHSSSSSSNSREESELQAGGSPKKKKKRKAREEVTEVGKTEMLPGSAFSLDYVKMVREAQEDNKENKYKNENGFEKEDDEDDNTDDNKERAMC